MLKPKHLSCSALRYSVQSITLFGPVKKTIVPSGRILNPGACFNRYPKVIEHVSKRKKMTHDVRVNKHETDKLVLPMVRTQRPTLSSIKS